MVNTITISDTDITEQERLIDDKSFREQFIERVEVLDKVKTLLTIPYMEVATINQVADYYGVDYEIVKKCYSRHKDEIDADGATLKTVNELRGFLTGHNIPLKITTKFLKGHDVPLKMTDVPAEAENNSDDCHIISFVSYAGKTEVTFPNGAVIIIPSRGIRCFSKRAVLRIGMLLRDSEIAREVRTQLLNVVEKAEQFVPHIVTESIEEEQSIMLDIGKAFASGDLMTFGNACTKLVAFKNRHIDALNKQNSELIEVNAQLMESNSSLTERNESLENTNQLLSSNIIKWTDRQTINRLVRCLAVEMRMNYRMAWNMLYKHLQYRYGISLKQRAAFSGTKAPLISFIRDNEWKAVEKTFAALLETRGIDADKFYKKAIPAIQTIQNASQSTAG